MEQLRRILRAPAMVADGRSQGDPTLDEAQSRSPVGDPVPGSPPPSGSGNFRPGADADHSCPHKRSLGISRRDNLPIPLQAGYGATSVPALADASITYFE